MERERRRSAGAATLTIQEGAGAGNEFKLQEGGETILGRQSDCHIVISDIAVSRKHASITQENGRYILRDLGSGNGTYMDGRPVSLDGQEISDGATFKMGDTEILFSVSGRRAPHSREAVRRPSRADVPAASRSRRHDSGVVDVGRRHGGAPEAPKKSKLKLVLIGVVCLGIVIVFAKVLMDQNAQNAQQAAEMAEYQSRVDAAQDKVSAAVDEGRNATRRGDFKAAVEHFNQAAKLVQAAHEEDNLPEVELPPDSKRNLEYSKKEVANQDLVDQAKGKAKEGHLSEAVKVLNGIPDDSFFFDKVKDVKAEFATYFPSFMERAGQYLKDKQFDEAEEAVEEILAVDRMNSAALTLQKDIERAAAAARRPVKKKVEVVEPTDPTLPALELFYAGQLDNAIATAKECQEPPCAKLVDKLGKFSTAFANIDSDANGAFDALMTIPGAKKSTFYRAIAGKISISMTKEGVSQMGNQNYAAAFKAFSQVVSLDPNNAVAHKHLGTIHQKAQEIFQQSYVMKGMDAEGARRGFEKVVSMTGASDELNQKAKRQLKSLSGGF